MDAYQNSTRIIRKLMIRLLPIQILLALVGSINAIVSGYFAGNYVGIDALSAVALYSPLSMLLGAIYSILAGGCAIICGRYLGSNQQDKLQGVFSLDLVLSTLISILFIILFVGMSLFDLTGIFTNDAVLRPIFNRYLLGQAIGLFPLILGNQLPSFLSLENQGNRTMLASLVYIVVNLILNYVFVQVLRLEEFGLSLASSLGMWIFLLVQAEYFFTRKSLLKMSLRNIEWKQYKEIILIGFPGAASLFYQTARSFIVNRLLTTYTGSTGLSAFGSANSLMGFFWAIPGGMLAVSRLLISVSVGEEDRQTLCDIFKVLFACYIPLMMAVDALVIVFAGPMASVYFKDVTSLVHIWTASCLRILPLCMPFSVIMMHFTCYGQTSNKQVFVNVLSLLDGAVCVCLFSWLLIGRMGVEGVAWANVLNGIVTTAYIVLYACFMKKRFPRSMDDLLVIPDGFGVAEDERIDLSLTDMDEVVQVAERIQNFCREKGIDERRAYLAGLAMEEMAGNVIEHGFHKDNKKHSVDIRVAHKNDNIILRIKDDCVPFDPKERNKITAGDDLVKNIGIRMIYQMTDDIDYQNILGLNVLTIRI
ncbi:MAG: ATP-binding protein [Erysipelotrichaceae bacterium]|nr:ATP-binding protein [Erysipelotrichaceae bacterium]